VRPPRLTCAFLLIVCVTQTYTHSTCADEVSVTSVRRTLAESSGEVPPHSCLLPTCATVLSVRHADINESPPPIAVQGPLKKNPPFGPYDPHVPPIAQPSAEVQKHKDIWVIEILLRDGTVRAIEQNYPALFQVGDWVVVDGERIRAAD